MDIYGKSFEILKKIIASEKKYSYKIFLLGGWAVWLYNPYMKSKDIDFIVEKKHFWKFRNFVESIGFRETAKVLQKHGFSMMFEGDKIELDVYTEKIGKWPVNELIDDFCQIKVMTVLSPTKLFMLKSFTSLERHGTAKGEKDMSDLVALMDAQYDKIDYDFIKNQVDLQTVFSVIFPNFQLTSKIYPISIKKYKEITSYLKKSGFK
ncbi:MAG TPA: hypothetical protein VJB11_04195 [archaeon]|nr:hypothetical protein [archaeon]